MKYRYLNNVRGMPKIMVLGLRGVPGIQGGVETHAEKLYPILARIGCDVEIITRTPFHSNDTGKEWSGVKLKRLWAPQITGLEAFLHTLLGVLYAGVKRPDILHIHAIGPAIFAPLARLLGLKVVVTHHGFDYEREKWGTIASYILKAGESLGMRFANKNIGVSRVICKFVKEKYRNNCVYIPNGVSIPEPPKSNFALKKYDLYSRKYILQVSRMVPEKRQIDLIHSFVKANLVGWKLVLVGALYEHDNYSNKIKLLAKKHSNIVLTGFLKGLPLQEIYANAGVFVLPSSHEGLAIVLLEALSYGIYVLASDIPPNLEIELSPDQYFSLGKIDELTDRIKTVINEKLVTRESCQEMKKQIKEKYDWELIAIQTLTVYKELCNKNVHGKIANYIGLK